jgi:hypothetical protein
MPDNDHFEFLIIGSGEAGKYRLRGVEALPGSILSSF